MKYNPSFLSDDELINSFVVRHNDFEIIMRIIRENVTQSNQHVLITGPRGIGKTTLALRIAAEVRRDKDLKGEWYPLVFAEESYQVITPGEFWLEALFHLGQQTGEERWRRAYEELTNEKDEKRLRERALAQLMDFADTQGNRLLLIVENFNMLLGDQISDDDAWIIRHALLNEPRIMLLATATNHFEEIENSDKAMFDLFKVHELKPLDREECRTVWASTTGNELEDNRIRPVQILTGGNPRLLTIISSFGAKLSFKELMSDLIQLVDDHTEYFKSHLDSLPPIERKVYLALAELWDPATARDVAKAARFDVNKTSSLLNRLIERGAVVVVDDKRRAKWYQVAERMYNIYYLMRRRGMPSSRVRAVVNFMISFYEQDELIRAIRLLAEEACQLDPEQCEDHLLVYKAIIESTNTQEIRDKILASTPQDFLRAIGFKHTEANLDEVNSHSNIAVYKSVENKGTRISKIIQTATTLATQQDKLDKAEHLYRKAVQIEPHNPFPWTKLGQFLQSLKRYDEAEATYRKAIEVDPTHVWGWTYLGDILRFLKRYEEAETIYRKAIEVDPTHVWGWLELGKALQFLKRYDEAEAAYRKAIEMEPDYAWGWTYLGDILQFHQRYEEAEAAYRKAIEMEPHYAWRWSDLGKLFHLLKRYDEAEEMYRRAVELEPDFIPFWSSLIGILLDKLGRIDEAYSLAERWLQENPQNPNLLNLFARNFYKYGKQVFKEHAEVWARKAVAMESNNPYFQHTHACILCALGKGNEALELARKYIQDNTLVARNIDDAADLYIGLAAAGCEKEALQILRESSSAAILEPLIIGIQLFMGEDVKVAAEILEIGKDVSKKIQERRNKLKIL